MSIQSPYEILDLGNGGVLDTPILKWELGQMTINVRRDNKVKTVGVLRIFIPLETKPIFPDYYDITATTLIAQLLPYLKQPEFIKQRFKITKQGVAPTARFTLEVAPL